MTVAEFDEVKDCWPASAAPVATSRDPQQRHEYTKPLREYQVTFKRRVRVIKGWVAIGRRAKDAAGNPAPDMPPLDEPENFPVPDCSGITEFPFPKGRRFSLPQLA